MFGLACIDIFPKKHEVVVPFNNKQANDTTDALYRTIKQRGRNLTQYTQLLRVRLILIISKHS